jgi:GAF domain-containing protein
LRRQRILADFGELTLRSNNLQDLLDNGCRLVAEALDTDLAKILEIEPGGDTAFVRAGYGWAAGIVGKLRLPMDVHSSETYALGQARPIVTQNIATETRFDFRSS